MKKSVAAEGVSSLLILLFGYTAFSKLFNHSLFEAVLQQVPLIGTGAAVIALLLPLCELFIVLLLLFPRTRLIGLKLSLVLLVMFTVYLGYMVLFVPKLPCSCGGVISKMSWRQHIGFNAAVAGLTVLGIRSVDRRLGDRGQKSEAGSE